MKRFVLICLFLIALTPDLWAETPDPRPLTLVCSTTQIADFTRQVTGDLCRIVSILKPGADPHTYMPTPGDASLVLSADLCLENGLHLEGKNWMETLARDANKPLVTCTAGITPLTLDEDGRTMADPHAWFSPKNAAAYVNTIVSALAALDPGNADQYRARARLYLQQLRVLDGWIRELVNAIPPDRRVLVTSHDAFNYFCTEYRFNARFNYLSLAPVGWSTGSEVGGGMTPKRFKAVVDSIRSFNAPAVFVETSVNPKLIREIAREAGVSVGGLLYSDSMGETDSAAETYIGMMRENVMTIVHALK
ncbi:metal ABC transporter solute-binding protein, Zn/Mn family [Desulfatiferula olefinivorans]